MLRKILIPLLSLLLCFSASPSFARESLDEHAENTDALYRMGTGAKDGAYTATATSMFAWGAALFIAIGIIAAVIKSSGHTKSTTTSSSSSSSSDTR